MPYYYTLKHRDNDSTDSKNEKNRIINNLKKLRDYLKNNIPVSKLDFNLILATWNIREFDSTTFGTRLNESFFYISEIIASFDLVAIQEVNRSMVALERVMKLLGPNWNYVISDTTEGDQGNDERIAYVYNNRKVQFGGLAGEVVLPNAKEKIDDPENPGEKKTIYKPMSQLWRTPLICGFTAGWAKFMLCNVHIQWGESELSRKKEIDHIANFIKSRTEDEKAWARKLILLGDFNISDTNSDSYKMLKEADYTYPVSHKNITTTVGVKKSQYDRIFIRERKDGIKILQGGTIPMFDILFTDADEATYKPLMKKKNGEPAKQYNNWRTHQLSDHQPLWVEFQIDYADEYLENLNK
ncbi:endonuclease/exonuclease/phosphatase family metal-dependent hydrolase [Saonia flava]|uniref:Endonuclease/exonuclease/phosphatase family metal-dependent hydrolase n=1 Tax=Saonia flava TaxID=523696 RepID=A0A846QZH3_9FLAO|nr:endonuclease/exonuclease/phosphatase family protein [Saonia flava]NJB70534.1 endonuclease/exonuclease/phosphatase family metal-dependent hydrolase [Saonia flava]